MSKHKDQVLQVTAATLSHEIKKADPKIRFLNIGSAKDISAWRTKPQSAISAWRTGSYDGLSPYRISYVLQHGCRVSGSRPS